MRRPPSWLWSRRPGAGRPRTEEERRLVDHLLGRGEEQERRQIEERFLADEQYFEQMLALEDELHYDYAQGRLQGPERERFEKRFLHSPEGQTKQETARALLAGLSTLSPPPARGGKTSWWTDLPAFLTGGAGVWKPLAGVALLAFAFVLLWLALENAELRDEVDLARSQPAASHPGTAPGLEEERLRARQLEAELARERQERARLERSLAEQRPAPPLAAAFVLTPGLTRDQGSTLKRISVPAAVELVRFQLATDTEPEHALYQVTLLTAEGAEVWSRRVERDLAGRSLIVEVPAAVLVGGDYELTLSGVGSQGTLEDLAGYYFSVAPRRTPG